ncbi:SDR family NAD(P)-dependent oxidoreductase [Micromonospora carbonacea]|uniref:SDR family oxidoreductase n=1 Tax=Micromonospora carbonacea TaxID=47853 RepID=A0A7H8XDM0_9ACTN|nr:MULTISPECIES: SDR family oxidoreductase [Micromonospora]MBB5829675.1 short-subunit dehydrogenase [Micromonospora carbonacea]QLD22935.1 SDR family oxidoreductase [Micromonospora carbonacea]WFE58939.1 SDR family oxidoreductase [Micromonospora sp. WMMD712]
MTSEQVPAVRRALVTGATAGIGAEFARRLAADGWALVLVARDAARLAEKAAELTGRYGHPVEVIPADLSTADGCAEVERRLTGDGQVDLLVNNAGISLNQPFLRSSPDDESRLLGLNVHAVLRLTRAAIGPMIRRGDGAVINVSSVAGFGPVMPGSTYPASKAWVTAFSESIDLTTRPRGVRVMALCPGYTRTGAHERIGIDMSGTPRLMWLRAEQVVDEALRDLRKGRSVSVPSRRYKLAVAAVRHAPRGLLRRFARDTRGRDDRHPG